MKMFVKFLVVATALLCYSNSKAQKTTTPSNSLDGTPQLTREQMLVDYDSLVSYINQISPIIYFNKEVRGIDFNKHAKKLKKTITSQTSREDYLFLIQKTLNVAQDGHTSRPGKWLLDIIKNNWIPNGLSDIDTLDFPHNYKYDEFLNSNFYTKTKLELVYSKGFYYNLLPFSYKGKNYPAAMKLISCNGKEIDKLVKNMEELIAPLRWDRANNKVYHENFYTVSALYKKNHLKLTFADENKQQHLLNITKGDTVTFLEKKNNNFGYNSNSDPVITHYFEKEQLFYGKIPTMDEKLGDTLIKHFQTIKNKFPIKAIVLDVRGNGGGSDNTYGKFLGKILKDTLQMNLTVGYVFSPLNGLKRDTIIKYGLTFKIKEPTFKNVEMFYSTIPKFSFFYPAKEQIPFEGPIYILQDRFIFSSSNNLSSIAYKTKNIISIGEMPNLLGGVQTRTAVYSLPFSKFIFRIEPQIDFTDCKTLADIFQNQVEHFVAYPIDFLHERATTKEDILGKDFLHHKDPMFKKVLELELKLPNEVQKPKS